MIAPPKSVTLGRDPKASRHHHTPVTLGHTPTVTLGLDPRVSPAPHGSRT